MTKEEAINYLKSSGMSDEQIRTVVDAFTCEDCISRQAVLDIVRFENKWLFDARSTNRDTDIAFENIMSKISNLPPVQPKIKTGHWILLDECTNSGYYCSECRKKVVKEGWSDTVKKIKYCPNCMARMEVNNDI